MPPTKEPLAIIVGGLDATLNIPVGSIQINLELGNRVPSATFTIQDAASFGVRRWQTILIVSPDYATQYFLGYITDYSLQKRGITRDYAVTCSSIEVRLQKSTLNHICSGTDTDIINCMFANSLPDLTDLFDFTGITDLRLDSFDFPALDMNLLDALDQLSSKVNANYSWSPSENTRVNHFSNPNMNTDGGYLSGVLPDGSDAKSNYSSWNSANVAWGDSYGDSSGGMQITLQTISSVARGFLVIGNSTKHAVRYNRIEGGSLRISTSLYHKKDAGTTNLFLTFEVIVYDANGEFVKTLGEGSLGGMVLTSWNQSARDLRYLIDSDDIPLAGYLDVIVYFEQSAPIDASTVNVEKIMIEAIESVGGFYPTEYFDGEQKDAGLTGESHWMGTARDSASYLGDGQAMNWSDTPPNAAYDIDIGTDDFINDLQLEDMALDGINTVVVTGAFVYVDVDYEYPSNNQLTHFDLEESVFPQDGATYPIIYKNTGSDGTPTWTAQTVGNRIDDTLGVGNDCLYDEEKHWVEFNTAPADLKRGWRVVGRIKQRIRAVVEDEFQVADDGVQLVAAIYNETASTEEDVYELGLAELARRAGTRRITFTTLEPGLLPGAEIDIADSSQGISETMIIKRVSKNYGIEGEFGGGYVRAEIEAGDHNPDLADIVAQNTAMATTRPPISASTADKALTQLYDDDNLPLWDDDNANLYQSTDT